MNQETEQNPSPFVPDNTDSRTETDAEDAKNDAVRRSKRKCLYILLIASLSWGFLTGLLPEDSYFVLFLEYAVPIFSALIVLVWCHIDSSEWNFTISLRLSIMLFLILLIAFPYYISVTRKGVAILETLGLAVLFAILYMILFQAGYLLGIPVYNLLYG